jgi:hypothetical protein
MGRKGKQAGGGNWAAGEVGLKREEGAKERFWVCFCFFNSFKTFSNF